MSELDRKILAAMAAYDAETPGTPEQVRAAVALEKAGAGISERDLARIHAAYSGAEAA